MSTRPSKKLTLKKETLRTLESAELPQLEGVMGGVSLAIDIIDNAPTKTVQPTVGPRTRTL